MDAKRITQLVEQHYDKGIVMDKVSGIKTNYNVSLNDQTGLYIWIEDERRLEPRHAELEDRYILSDGTQISKQPWLFTDSIAEDIAREELEFENWIHKEELRF